jgi:hypothetical protein
VVGLGLGCGAREGQAPGAAGVLESGTTESTATLSAAEQIALRRMRQRSQRHSEQMGAMRDIRTERPSEVFGAFDNHFADGIDHTKDMWSASFEPDSSNMRG